MATKGAKYRWLDGKILHSAYLYKYPTRRRIPRILIEDRAMQVGILMHIEEPWMVYEETKTPVSRIRKQNGQELRFYFNKFFLLPDDFEGIDTYEWLKKKNHKFLLWGENGKYYIKSHKNRG